MLVAAINEGLTQGVIALEPGADGLSRGDFRTYECRIGGLPAKVFVQCIGVDELHFRVAVLPTKNADRWLPCMGAGFEVGSVIVTGWLERVEGRWVQGAEDEGFGTFRCRQHLLSVMEHLDVVPHGYLGARPKNYVYCGSAAI